ncbi:MAG: acetyl-CoA acetyltransferase [Acidimicrobiia bacterium]|nr:acetyl-CoA acetyltransferase [Acidimicrobiia bacterium]MYB74569.1 acetyl-CoA acetyltransferase [Acidimicrobiia bacterium]MYH99666.1 acetyl-CoA acetyltransferase [Acidimicrobiia bacterium]
MSSDRAPVLVGVAQYVGRETDPTTAPDPVTMLADVATRAAYDSGVGQSVFTQVDTYLQIPLAYWTPLNGAALVAERLGIDGRARMQHTGGGGEIGVLAANHLADEILAGRTEVALMTGGQIWKTHERAKAAGVELDWPTGGDPTGADERFAPVTKPMVSEIEERHGLTRPIQAYPLFENALRAAQGLTLAEHAQRLGEMMTEFTAVAAANPYAWFPTERSAEELATPTPENRMIGFPYTKYLNAVLNTDQAGAYLMTSVAKARELGIPEDRWVYWWGGHNAAEEAWFASTRPNFAECPSMKDSSVGALDQAGVGADDIALFDFYSCFPIAVRMACAMLGIDELDPRPFTVTGGLPYAGGPGSAYNMNSIAAMVEQLREDDRSIGMVTGNGFFMTKHAAAVLSARPKQGGWDRPDGPHPSSAMETAAAVSDDSASGPGRIEAYTVMHDRDGQPSMGYICGRLDGNGSEGRRFLANTPEDPDLLRDLLASEAVGRTGHVRNDNDTGRCIFTPA